MSTDWQIELKLASGFDAAVTELLNLGIALGRLEGFDSFRVEQDSSLGISRRSIINIAVSFSTSVAASAAYDIFKSAISHPDTTFPGIRIEIIEVAPPSTPEVIAGSAASDRPARSQPSTNAGPRRSAPH